MGRIGSPSIKPPLGGFNFPTQLHEEESLNPLLELFEWYEFRDPNGHKLTKCRDFLELLELAKPRIGD